MEIEGSYNASCPACNADSVSGDGVSAKCLNGHTWSEFGSVLPPLRWRLNACVSPYDRAVLHHLSYPCELRVKNVYGVLQEGASSPVSAGACRAMARRLDLDCIIGGGAEVHVLWECVRSCHVDYKIHCVQDCKELGLRARCLTGNR